jgi:hypothetical protein
MYWSNGGAFSRASLSEPTIGGGVGEPKKPRYPGLRGLAGIAGAGLDESIEVDRVVLFIHERVKYER